MQDRFPDASAPIRLNPAREPTPVRQSAAVDELVRAVSNALDVEIVGLLPLEGGRNGGAIRLEVLEGPDLVLKAAPRAHPDVLRNIRRARRVVAHMRSLGYPTPAWRGLGMTGAHVWHVTEWVDAHPAGELTASLVDQLMAVVEMQADQGIGPHDHTQFAWQVVTGREVSLARVEDHSRAVATLVRRVRLLRVEEPAPSWARDMVHADLNPSNVLMHGGVLRALVDIENAGCGTRATDLTTLLWHTLDVEPTATAARLRDRIIDLVGQAGAALLASTQILMQLEWPIRQGSHHLVPATVDRGHLLLDHLDASL